MVSVIVRVLTARVPADEVAQFNQLLRSQLDELRGQPGLAYAKIARRLVRDDSEEVVLFEEWRTPADLWAWTRGQLDDPRLLPGMVELVEHLSIDHYESLDVMPGEPALTVVDGGTAPPGHSGPATPAAAG